MTFKKIRRNRYVEKTMSLIMVLVLCLSAMVFSASAADAFSNAGVQDGIPYDEFEDKLISRAQYYLRYLPCAFTSQKSVDIRVRELINGSIFERLFFEFEGTFEDELCIELSAQRYLEEVGKSWEITDNLLNILRSGGNDNPEKDTCTVYGCYYAGALGTPRVYRGYEKAGDYYKVYFRCTEGEMDFTSGVVEYYESLGYPRPNSFYYKGQEYADNMDDILYRITKELNNGLCFTMEVGEDQIKLVSVEYFSDVDMEVKDSGIVDVKDTSAFAKGTKVTVEEQTQGTIYNAARRAMRKISGNYYVYEFTATLDGSAVQPDGVVRVNFKIPEGFWHEDQGSDLSLYYLSPEGTLEELTFYVIDFGSACSAELSHFSTYILVKWFPLDNNNGTTFVVPFAICCG